MAAWRLQPLQPAGAHVKATVTHKTTIFGLEAAKHQWEWWLVYLGMGNYLINNGGFHPVIPTSYTNQLYQPVIPTSYTNRNQTMGVSIQFLLLGSIAIHRWFVLVWLCPAGGGKCIHQPDDDDWVPPKKNATGSGLATAGRYITNLQAKPCWIVGFGSMFGHFDGWRFIFCDLLVCSVAWTIMWGPYWEWLYLSALQSQVSQIRSWFQVAQVRGCNTCWCIAAAIWGWLNPPSPWRCLWLRLLRAIVACECIVIVYHYYSVSDCGIVLRPPCFALRGPRRLLPALFFQSVIDRGIH